jgi:hypothetical protein
VPVCPTIRDMRQQCSGVQTRQISFIRDHNVSLILQSAVRSHHSFICNYTSGIDSGAYQLAAPTGNHAFVKNEDMWSDPMDESEDQEEEAAPTRTIAEEPPVTRTEPTTRRMSSSNYTVLSTRAATNYAFSRTSQMDKPQRPGTLSRSTLTKLTR